MKNKPGERKKTRSRLIPDGELACIWMDAGIVSYKLCSYDYDCETCPFDSEMKTSGRSPRASPKELSLSETSPKPHRRSRRLAKREPEILEECFYHTGHTWVVLDEGSESVRNRIRVGVDNFAARVLPRVKSAILPHVGTGINQGQVFCWIVCASSTLPIVAPIGGTIIEANPQISERPKLINIDPHGEGWLVSVEPNDLKKDLLKLMKGRAAASWMGSERKKFERMASLLSWPTEAHPAQRGEADVGVTLADGGEWLGEMSYSVRVSQYFGFITKFFL